jgi:hypothetical protein
VPREAQLTSAPSRSAPTDRPHVGSVFYLLLVGLVAAAIIGVFFGVGVSLLTLPKDHTVVSAGPVPPGAEEAVRTAKAAPSPGDPPATIVASPGTAPVPDPTSHMPDSPASPPQVNSSAAAAEFAGPGAPTRSASGGSRSRAHTAIRRGQSAHHYRQPPAQAEKQRILSASGLPGPGWLVLKARIALSSSPPNRALPLPQPGTRSLSGCRHRTVFS